jgi:hypothetical protein
MTAHTENRIRSIFSKASVYKNTRNDLYFSSSMTTPNALREGDTALQSINTRRRYMRRGSRAPNMFGNSASSCRREEILALAQQATAPVPPPSDLTLQEIEFDQVFKNSERKRKMTTMDDLNNSMSSICTYDPTDDPVA